MSLDGIVIKSLEHELESKLLNGRIDKVYQPEKDEILINIRSNGVNYKLLISASSNNPRIYLTNTTKLNPEAPPMFCMLLRKHLQGGRIIGFNQPLLERVLNIEVQNTDELGNLSTKELIVEIMGRHSNIILVDKDSKKIIDSVKRVTEDISSVRQILPGFLYELPPSQGKLNPLDATEDVFLDKLNSTGDGLLVQKFLYTTYMGLSPLIGREVIHRAGLNNSKIGELKESDKKIVADAFFYLMEKIKKNKFSPNMIIDDTNNKVIAFSSVDITQYVNYKKIRDLSISSVLESFYSSRDMVDRVSQKSSEFKKIISNKLDRSLNKLLKQQNELKESEEREMFKIYGDLIIANLYRIKRGNSVELENFYSEEPSILTIDLDPRLTPTQNAQKYYKKYNKLKNAHEIVKKQIEITKEEIDYLENVIISIENCTAPEDLEEIKEELIKEGYLKSKSKSKKKSNTIFSKPHHFISTDGFDIYVGKNNKQNDLLTLKIAAKEDLWFHTKNIPGSHVIIKTHGNEPPETTIYEAALLASQYSKGKMSSNIPVDYTERRNVKKPSGAKPGMVIYESNKTIYVTPTDQEINNIKKVED